MKPGRIPLLLGATVSALVLVWVLFLRVEPELESTPTEREPASRGVSGEADTGLQFDRYLPGVFK